MFETVVWHDRTVVRYHWSCERENEKLESDQLLRSGVLHETMKSYQGENFGTSEVPIRAFILISE